MIEKSFEDITKEDFIAVRESAGLSISQTADLTGVGKATISAIERGSRAISKRSYNAYVAYFNTIDNENPDEEVELSSDSLHAAAELMFDGAEMGTDDTSVVLNIEQEAWLKAIESKCDLLNVKLDKLGDALS